MAITLAKWPCRYVAGRSIGDEYRYILERRLAQIGPEGDCGYEKALIRFFEQQLGERRARLQVVVRLATGD